MRQEVRDPESQPHLVKPIQWPNAAVRPEMNGMRFSDEELLVAPLSDRGHPTPWVLDGEVALNRVPSDKLESEDGGAAYAQRG